MFDPMYLTLNTGGKGSPSTRFTADENETTVEFLSKAFIHILTLTSSDVEFNNSIKDAIDEFNRRRDEYEPEDDEMDYYLAEAREAQRALRADKDSSNSPPWEGGFLAGSIPPLPPVMTLDDYIASGKYVVHYYNIDSQKHTTKRFSSKSDADSFATYNNKEYIRLNLSKNAYVRPVRKRRYTFIPDYIASPEETKEFVSKLKQSKYYELVILEYDECDEAEIGDIIDKSNKNLSIKTWEGILKHKKPFRLPSEKAKKLYTQLRNKDVYLTIKIPTAKKKFRKPIKSLHQLTDGKTSLSKKQIQI